MRHVDRLNRWIARWYRHNGQWYWTFWTVVCVVTTLLPDGAPAWFTTVAVGVYSCAAGWRWKGWLSWHRFRKVAGDMTDLETLLSKWYGDGKAGVK